MPTKVHLVKATVFFSSHVWMWELDHKESWALKNWCFDLWCRRRLLRVPWTARSSQSIKGNPSWIFIGRTDAEAEAPILWHLMWRTHWKRPWCWERLWAGGEKVEVIGWHHQLNGHEFEQAPGVGKGQRSLVCCSWWDHKDSDTTEWMNWTEKNKKGSHKVGENTCKTCIWWVYV